MNKSRSAPIAQRAVALVILLAAAWVLLHFVIHIAIVIASVVVVVAAVLALVWALRILL